MKIVFSYWNYRNSIDKSFIGMAKISNFFAQQHGYETILFCSEKEKTVFQDIPYNEVRVLPENLMKSFHPDLWSISKIVAMSLMDEPYIMIDFDLFLFKKIDYDKTIDVTFFHEEPWVYELANIKNKWLLDIKLENIKKDSNTNVYNCAVISVKNPELVKKCATEIVNHILNVDTNKLDYLLKEENFIKWNKKPTNFFLPVWVIEQVWLPQLIKSKNGNINSYYQISDAHSILDITINGHLHMWGSKGDQVLRTVVRDFPRVLDNQFEYKNIKYQFEFFEDLRKDLFL